jgi:hypothetical protein
MAADIRDVDPAELRLPSSRSSGADPGKLQRQIAKHGTSTAGMPLLIAYEGSDGVLELYDGVTRATRARETAAWSNGESRSRRQIETTEDSQPQSRGCAMKTDLMHRIVQKLTQVRLQSPDLRFGQLVAVIGELAADESEVSLWDVEDTDFAAALDRFAEDLAKRKSGISEPTASPDLGGTPIPGSTPFPSRGGAKGRTS